MMDASKHTVYIVDDHPLVREWLAALFRESACYEAIGGQDNMAAALIEIVALRPNFAVVDLALKGSSGLDLIRELQTKAPETLCVVLSMYDEVHYAEQSFAAGARGFVAKEEATERIIEALGVVQTGGVYGNAQMMQSIALRASSRVGRVQARPIDSLSEREFEIYSLLGGGKSSKEIAFELNISTKTVHVYCARIKAKLGFTSGAELVREATLWKERRMDI
jgi:DNA-binding NarL/FixJ family response regulator